MSGTQKSSLDRGSGVCRISGVVSSSPGRGMGFFEESVWNAEKAQGRSLKEVSALFPNPLILPSMCLPTSSADCAHPGKGWCLCSQHQVAEGLAQSTQCVLNAYTNCLNHGI